MKLWLWIAGVVLVGGLFVAFSGNAQADLQGDAVVYKSSSCGCCGVWTGYVDRAGLDVTVINREDMNAVKDQYGIPAQLRSCHTMEIDGYFVEGHIPQEAIAKLLAERPDIAGIAMPGMPSGSPGMPGAKQGPFIVYAVNDDGTYDEFMRV